MMKTKNLSMMAAIVAAVLAGCSNDDGADTPQSVLPVDNVIRLEAGVNNMQTRAVGYDGNGLDELGLFVENANSDTYTYSNVCMKKDASGTWDSYESDGTTPWTMLWQSETAEVSVTAYAPYVEGTAAGSTITGTVEGDQTTEENGRKSDVLYAAASVTPNAPDTSKDIYYDTDAKKLNVNMGHALSKLTVNIRYGTEMTQDGGTPSPTAITLGETMTGYNLDLGTGGVEASGSAADITMMMLPDAAATGYSTSAEAILVPQAAAFTITVTIDGRTFVYNNAEFEFEKGNAYTLNLLVGKDIVNIGDITASAWTTNDGGSLETE